MASRQQAAGSRQQAAGSRQQAAGSRQQAAGSRQQAAGSRHVPFRFSQVNLTAAHKAAEEIKNPVTRAYADAVLAQVAGMQAEMQELAALPVPASFRPLSEVPDTPEARYARWQVAVTRSKASMFPPNN